ncbi:opsin 8, group member c isoform X2 [Mugil cephalus]|uniref:opsin 8, group member c isoform X2 n=1 Tax=Mugil cephalus TaxID=48193 RepID=UPI001FB834CD|nr:opsin 8, group member c isoform X2 [Mugil cephalus]
MPLNSSEDNLTVSAFTSKLSPAADRCVGLAILSVVLLSIVGNGLVLVICYRRRKKMVGSELLCVNLAVVDFLSCVCFYPLSILSSFHHAWLGENVTCIYYGLGCYIFGLCGMFTIAAISVLRYLKTCCSLAYAVWLNEANIRLVCCAIWVVATVWSCFPLFGWGEYVPEPYGLSCTIAWRGYHTSAKDAFYVICSFACFTLVPVLLIVVSQCRILHKVSHFSYSLSARGIRNNLRHTEKRLSMMFFCISLGFVIAWAPYAVVSFLFIFHKGNRTFQREFRSLVLAFYHKLGANRVGVRSTSGHQPQHPIHIQLRERGCGQKKTFGLSGDRNHGKIKNKGRDTHTSSNCVHGRMVYVCWGSTSKNGPNILDRRPTKTPLPVSL